MDNPGKIKRKASLPEPAFWLSFLRDVSESMQQESRQRTPGAKYILLEDSTPLEGIAERLARLDIRSAQRLHMARLEEDTPSSFVQRFLYALDQEGGQEGILDAWVEGEELVVLSPGLKRLHVPLESLPGDVRDCGDGMDSFRIDPYGAFLHWPGPDIHMGWEQFLQILRPQVLLRARQQSDSFNSRYGQAIRSLRRKHGLTQSKIPGLTSRTVRRIERGETRATAKAIRQLAKAHGLEPQDYMDKLAQSMKTG